MKKELKVLTPTGMLGYGFPPQWFERGLSLQPDVITADSGSTDSGPQKLGLGAMTCTYDAYYRDLEMMICGGQKNKIPVFISSAGGDGSDQHVDVIFDMVKDIAAKHGFHLKAARIYAGLDKETVKQGLREGRVSPCGPVPELTEEEIDLATVIVAQMGVEPYLKLLDEHPDIDVIIGGRAYDPVPIAALGIKNGFDPAYCWHMGKIAECGAQCAEPAGRVILGTLQEDGFILEAMNPAEICHTYSAAAHTLYEKSHPYLLPGPGGTLDLSGCRFEQIDERRVKISGSKFCKAETYTVKMEGARPCGYRSIAVTGIRDPILISQIDPFLKRARNDVYTAYPELKDSTQIIYHVYGKNGVMGELEPVKTPAHELCVIVEAVAQDQETATKICNKTRVQLLHNPYEGRIATAGNIASPFTPLEIPLGQVCMFNVYHLLAIDDPVALFKTVYEEV